MTETYSNRPDWDPTRRRSATPWPPPSQVCAPNQGTADPILPHLEKTTEQFKAVLYRVTPQERFEASQAYSARHGGWGVDACREMSSQVDGHTTLDLPDTIFLDVEELVYARDRGESEKGEKAVPIQGKWVYVFNLARKECVAEAFAVVPAGPLLAVPTEFKYRSGVIQPESLHNPPDSLAATPQLDRTGSFIEIKMEPGDCQSHFAVFLTPIRLSKRGLKFLLAELPSPGVSAAESGPVVKPKWETVGVGYVAVPDPFAWCCETSQSWCLRAYDRWQEFNEDEEEMAKVFIAGVLESWRRAGESDVQSHLVHKSGRGAWGWLDEHKDKERSKRYPAEAAYAYLGQQVDSPEHKAVEKSGEDRGSNDLSCCFQQWGICTRNMLGTAPGRAYAEQLLAQKDRLPRKILFNDKTVVLGLDFRDARYAWRGAATTVFELLPVAIRAYKDQGLDEQTKLAKAWLSTVYFDVVDGVRVTRNGKSFYRFADGVFPGWVLEALDEAPKQAGDLPLKDQWHKLHGYSHRHSKWFVVPSLPIEIANVCFALQALSSISSAKTTSGQKADRIISIIDESADLIEFVASAFSKVATKGIAKTIGFAGMIAGVCGVYEHFRDAQRAWKKGNDGALVGSSIAMFGEGLGVLGAASVLARAWQIGGAALVTGWGAIVMGIGMALVGVGSLLRAWLTESVYEEFAKYSFLGKLAQSLPQYCPQYVWVQGSLPFKDRFEEARNAMGLISAFKLQRKVGAPGGLRVEYVEILATYFDSDAVFEVEMEQEYSGLGSFKAHIQWRASEDKFIGPDRNDTLIPDVNYFAVSRDKDRQVTSVRIPLHPAFVIPTGRSAVKLSGPSTCTLSLISVRMKLGDVQTPPRCGWVVLDTLRENSASSLSENDVHYSLSCVAAGANVSKQ